MPPRTPAYRMADRLAGGKLDEIVKSYRDEQVAWSEIIRRLYADHGIEVSVETLRGWTAEAVA